MCSFCNFRSKNTDGTTPSCTVLWLLATLLKSWAAEWFGQCSHSNLEYALLQWVTSCTTLRLPESSGKKTYKVKRDCIQSGCCLQYRIAWKRESFFACACDRVLHKNYKMEPKGIFAIFVSQMCACLWESRACLCHKRGSPLNCSEKMKGSRCYEEDRRKQKTQFTLQLFSYILNGSDRLICNAFVKNVKKVSLYRYSKWH